MSRSSKGMFGVWADGLLCYGKTADYCRETGFKSRQATFSRIFDFWAVIEFFGFLVRR